MSDRQWLGQRFEQERPHLTAVARRLLGSPSDADDAVQEAWLRLSRSDPKGIDNLGGWLTTVVSRVCLNELQARRTHAEVPLADEVGPEPAGTPLAGGRDPEQELLLAESVELAAQVVLATLTPAERVSFVLHDTFGIPFHEVARILGRSTPAVRQLASRARRRVRQADADAGAMVDHDAVVQAVIAAIRAGDVPALVALLAPDAVLDADAEAVAKGAAPQTRGAEAVADFARQARGVRPVVLGGWAAAAWMPGGHPRVALRFTVRDGLVRRIELIADPAALRALALVL